MDGFVVEGDEVVERSVHAAGAKSHHKGDGEEGPDVPGIDERKEKEAKACQEDGNGRDPLCRETSDQGIRQQRRNDGSERDDRGKIAGHVRRHAEIFGDGRKRGAESRIGEAEGHERHVDDHKQGKEHA